MTFWGNEGRPDYLEHMALRADPIAQYTVLIPEPQHTVLIPEPSTPC